MEFHIHWFAVTVWASLDHAHNLWHAWLESRLGVLHDQGYGGRLYKKIFKGLAAAKLYCLPQHSGGVGEAGHFHLELPGTACEALPPETLQEFFLVLQRNDKFRVKRIDLAWDGVPFTPVMLDQADKQDLFITRARRETFRFEHSRHNPKENGEIGHSIFRLGSRASSRHLRVYDYHGPVRLEMEARGPRADLIAGDVLPSPPDEWSDKSIPHLRDFVEIDAPYWHEFVKQHVKAGRTIVDARTKELSRIAEWMFKQVSPSLSVLVDVIGEGTLKALIENGRKKRGDKFKSLLNDGGEE